MTSASVALPLLLTASLLAAPGKHRPARAASVQGGVAPFSCPSCDLRTKSFAGMDLTDANLSNAILEGVDLHGLTLSGAQLQGARLKGANLNGAILTRSSKGRADFTNADLTSTTFVGAQLDGVSFQFTTLSCTDFSSTNISTSTFGPALNVPTPQPGSCRVKFSGATLSCEFIGSWALLDLTQANVSACWSQLKGGNFANALMPGVQLSSGDPNNPTDLTGTKWNGANLVGASFAAAILANADFSGTVNSPGADLTNANLTFTSAPSANFNYADLSADQSASNPLPAARLNFAYLGNSSFQNANLRFADFGSTDLTGNMAVFLAATLDGARFQSANLSGIDFSGVTSALGIDLTNANLTNSNLKNLKLRPNTFNTCGSQTTLSANLTGAFLCGGTLDNTDLTCANLTAAFMATSAQSLPGPDGGTITCNPTSQQNPITTGIQPLATSCFTTCPDGNPGPCSTAARWLPGRTPASTPCCSVKPGSGQSCPPRKRSGFSCTTNCDCVSQQCTNGLCQ